MSKSIANDLAYKIYDRDLNKFAIENMIEFGQFTIESRALPDYRDGLKPVQRRILWAMQKAGFYSSGTYVKCARVTGEVMGKYHPHGDCYDVIVNMRWSSTPPILSKGNFGELNTSAAAPRYTECKLAPYSEKILLDTSYLNVTDMQPNYDGNFDEPIVLPALLPHLLLNGSQSIAVGVIVGIPAFETKGVANIIKKALKAKVEVKDCIKHLKIKYPHLYDCDVITTAADLKDFYTTGQGRLTMIPKYKIENNKMIITKFTQHFDMEKVIPKLMQIDEVTSAENQSGKAGFKLEIALKTSVSLADRASIFDDCLKKMQDSINLNINVIRRVNQEKVLFKHYSMPELINNWTKWRISLETKRALYIAKQLAEQIKRLQLYKLACLNIDKIVPVIKSNQPDVESRLAKILKITNYDAKIILEMTLRRLTGLSLKSLEESIKNNLSLRKQAIYEAKHPEETILGKIDKLIKLLPE